MSAIEGTSVGANKCARSSTRPSAIARSISAGTPIAPVNSKRLMVLSGTPDRVASVLRDQSFNSRTCLARSPRSVVIAFGVLNIRDIILSIIGHKCLLQITCCLLINGEPLREPSCRWLPCSVGTSMNDGGIAKIRRWAVPAFRDNRLEIP